VCVILILLPLSPPVFRTTNSAVQQLLCCSTTHSIFCLCFRMSRRDDSRSSSVLFVNTRFFNWISEGGDAGMSEALRQTSQHLLFEKKNHFHSSSSLLGVSLVSLCGCEPCASGVSLPKQKSQQSTQCRHCLPAALSLSQLSLERLAHFFALSPCPLFPPPLTNHDIGVSAFC